ncbi:MAG: glycerol-3-phosphate acyltransferase [Actinobacteria bacterium]|nr:MAG: glycerol-3-phosphate acyltransferase [Actinomycetota bacterium]
MNDVNPLLSIGAIIVSYFLGTFPSALLVAKRGGVDVTAAGSGNPGTSNVVRLLGWKYGLVVFVADVLKGSASVGLAWLAMNTQPNAHPVSYLAYACGYAAVIGHTFPVTRKFVGGKGVATGGGVMYVLYPIMSLILCTSWFVLRKSTGKSSIASLIITVAVPVYVAFWRNDHMWELAASLGLVGMIIIRHLPNIRRLKTHEENA